MFAVIQIKQDLDWRSIPDYAVVEVKVKGKWLDYSTVKNDEDKPFAARYLIAGLGDFRLRVQSGAQVTYYVREFRFMTYEELCELPTLNEGQTQNLKIVSEDRKVWLDRSALYEYADDMNMPVEPKSRFVFVNADGGKVVDVFVADGIEDGFNALRKKLLKVQRDYYELEG